jgi:hypothetical protein
MTMMKWSLAQSNIATAPITSNQQPSVVAEPALAVLDHLRHPRFGKRCRIADADVLQHLRKRLVFVADDAHRLRAPLDDGEDLQCRNEAIAGRAIIGQNDVARLFAADAGSSRSPIDNVTKPPRACLRLHFAPLE